MRLKETFCAEFMLPPRERQGFHPDGALFYVTFIVVDWLYSAESAPLFSCHRLLLFT
jgi:hypothetical protein